MNIDADVAVVGLGAMGSMALWRLAERGVTAIGIDRFDPPHDRGSSHGESRLFRTAYAEGTWYVPLLREAWQLWRELEATGDVELLTQTGALMIGRSDGRLLSGTLDSARAFALAHELFDVPTASSRWPQHVLTENDSVLFEPLAGVLRPEACIRAALTHARSLGAAVLAGTRVISIAAAGEAVRVGLESGSSIHTRHAIVAAGPWTGSVLPELAPHLRVERQVTAWFAADDQPSFDPAHFPVFVRELHDGALRYGVPDIGGGIKIAVHHEGAAAAPDALDRTVSDRDLAPVEYYASRLLHGVRVPALRAIVCMYTNTPDEHLLVGRLRGRHAITVVGGCSGHSFKFAPMLGDIAADLAVEGGTHRDIAALTLDRLAERVVR